MPEDNVIKVVVKSFKKIGFKQTSTKILDRFSISNGKRLLQVETLGSDGERPHLSTGMQELEDLLLEDTPLAQYDIEDMDTTAPHMDAKN